MIGRPFRLDWRTRIRRRLWWQHIRPQGVADCVLSSMDCGCCALGAISVTWHR